MIIPNAHITSLKVVAGEKGDGSPALGSELITGSRFILCRVSDPSWKQRQTAQARSIEVERIVTMMRGELTSRGVTPGMDLDGARLTLKDQGGLGSALLCVVTHVGGGDTGGLSGAAETVVLYLGRAS